MSDLHYLATQVNNHMNECGDTLDEALDVMARKSASYSRADIEWAYEEIYE